jgi:hypothetical protein
MTDASGQAETMLTPGTTAGMNPVTANLEDGTGAAAIFQAMGTADPVTRIALVTGNNQIARFGAEIGMPLV